MSHATPIAESERIAELDALRGVALFGVFLANLTGFTRWVMATESQLLALPTVGWDVITSQLVAVFVHDKANTLFAFLFGVGFWLQLQRVEARGVDFNRLYLRRLTVLLLFGSLHLVFLWTWDILHAYAIAGFLLLALRRASDRVLLFGGLALALVVRELVKIGLGWGESPDVEWFYSDEAVLLRQQLAAAGDYPGLLRNFTFGLWADYLVGGGLAAWLLYVLGRFMIGAWVARRGWLMHPARYLDGFRRVRRIGLLYGVLLSASAEALGWYTRPGRILEWSGGETAAEFLHLISTPLLAAGYVAAIVLALRGVRGATLLWPFAAAGRMALTNYIMQSFIYALLFFGGGPGLALGGRFGMLACLGIAIVGYALQMAFSTWWLARFRYGPLEWCWRALTYGERPAMRRAPLTVVPSSPR